MLLWGFGFLNDYRQVNVVVQLAYPIDLLVLKAASGKGMSPLTGLRGSGIKGLCGMISRVGLCGSITLSE